MDTKMAGDRQVFGHHFMIQRVRTGRVNKLLAFGGDFLYPELSYAHAKIARRVCAKVLAAKVEDGFCQEEEAVELGKWMFFDNVASLFFPGAFQQG
ncbi:MAG: hypothetical protein RB191_03785 [Terriglobia bacterium]|nr:hypothetical protein [Terriglobia bacterium]